MNELTQISQELMAIANDALLYCKDKLLSFMLNNRILIPAIKDVSVISYFDNLRIRKHFQHSRCPLIILCSFLNVNMRKRFHKFRHIFSE